MTNENYEVRDEKIEPVLKDIGELLGKAIPEDYGFTLFLFNFGDKGNMFYISNSKREDMTKAMKEFLIKQGALEEE